ncbi:pancreatic lipase-related protein 2-like [Discoglossus pictus]
MFVFWAVWILFLGVLKGEEDCYEYPKCFPNDGPWSTLKRHCPMPEPQSPEKVNTTFHLYTRKNNYTSQVLSARNLTSISSSNFNTSKMTYFIIHGYMENAEKTWVKEMCWRLLQVKDCNCIAVDYSGGANNINYFQSASNARVAGAEVAYLLKVVQSDLQYNVSKAHVIGHSLGAQVAGEAGRRIKELGRITALDPAAPCFKCTDPVASLDRSDAKFVDIIHTASGDCSQDPLYCEKFLNKLFVDFNNPLNLGICLPIGHKDFYPNNAENFQGCPLDTGLPNTTILNDPSIIYRCAHTRSITYFLNSIKNSSIYVGYPCSDYNNFKAGNCRSCPSTGCPTMGLYANNYAGVTNGSQRLYLTIEYTKKILDE